MKTENAFLQLTNFDYTKNLICELNPMISCEKTKCLCEYEKKDILWNRAHNNSYCSKTYWTIFMDGKRRNTVTMLLTNGWFGRFFSLYQNDINSKFHSLFFIVFHLWITSNKKTNIICLWLRARSKSILYTFAFNGKNEKIMTQKETNLSEMVSLLGNVSITIITKKHADQS